jgi:D-xylose transport system substrate-binding protein
MSGRNRTSISGRLVRLVVACVAAGGLAGACGASSPSSGTATEPPAGWLHTANGQGCLIGVSYFNSTDLIDWEAAALEKALLDAGANFQEADAKAMSDTQVSDIDGLIAAGAKVIVIEPGPEDVILPALERAANAGIPLVTFFTRPLEHARSLYVAFDPIEQGRQVARGLLAEKPKGDYAIIKGDAGSLESDLITSGIREILQPAVGRGDIKIVAEVETSDWNYDLAQKEMMAILSRNGGRVDAVAVVNDDLAWGVARALADTGLTGSVAVGGASDRQMASAGLTAIVQGTQAVDAWGNPERLGEAEAHAAIALCNDPDITRVDGSASVTWPGRDPMQAILLAPVLITKDNIGIAVQTSTEWRQAICGYNVVPEPDWLPACQGWTPQP